jgi:DNA-binding MarR family transcriptional regulator
LKKTAMRFLRPSRLLWELHILRELEQYPDQTQKVLARRAGLSPPRVNSLIKQMEKSGWVEKADRSTRRYLLTSEGRLRQESLWREYLQELMGILESGRGEVSEHLAPQTAASSQPTTVSSGRGNYWNKRELG